MQAPSRYAIGIRFGLITGLLYTVLLFLRYRFFASTPDAIFYFTVISYFIILMMYLIAGIARKRQLGGYAELQEIFQTIFISILITELFYVGFNFIYLKYLDPGFLERFEADCLAYYKKKDLTPEQVKTEIQSIKALSETIKPGGLLKGFGTIIVIDSIFGFIFAAIVRRKKPAITQTK